MSHEKYTQSELESQIDAIMKSFDFEKVLKHMTDTDHKWYIREDETRIPTLEELIIWSRSCLVKAAYHDAKCTNVGTGGFMAYKMPWGMSLTFQLTYS